MNISPKISVILPVYNSDKYIGEAVESILNQTISDFELIIINDASTDSTLNVLKSYTDPRITLVNNEQNLKVVKSLNLGLSLAKGEYIARMDADDISLPYRFEKQLAYLQSHPHIDICSSWVEVIGEQNYVHKPNEHHDDIKAALLFLNVIIHPSVMARRKCVLTGGFVYDERYVNAEDYGLWAKLVDKSNFAIIPEVLLKYRIHGQNVSVPNLSNIEVLLDMNLRIHKIWLEKLGVPHDQQSLIMHKDIGLRLVNPLSINEFREHLQWLKKIVYYNKKSNYIKPKSLQGEIIGSIRYLLDRTNKSLSAYYLAAITLLTTFTPIDYWIFVIYKIKIKYNKNKTTIY